MRSVARAYDIPANQVFHWRKLYRGGRLGNAAQAIAPEMVAVRVLEVQQESSVEQTAMQPAITPSLGVIQIESGKGRLCIQRGSGSSDVTSGVGAIAGMITLPAGTQIWIAAGLTDLRRGFTGLMSTPVENWLFRTLGARLRW